MTTHRTRSALLALVWAAGGALCLLALRDVGTAYRQFAVRQEGLNFLPPSELIHYLWYATWGSLGTACFAAAFARTRLPARLCLLPDRLARTPWAFVAGVAAIAIACSAALHRIVLLGHPVADDELVLAFEAQTLLRGRVVNPPLPEPAFFANQYVTSDAHGWFGKYPIGHPLVLALGEALGVRWLVAPVLGGLSIALTFCVGRRLFGPRRALFGIALLAVSPQFVATHATQLSQTTSSLAMLAGLWLALEMRDDPRPRWAALAGLAWGFALVVRPMPGALFLAVLLAGHVAERGTGTPGARATRLLAAAPAVLAAAACLAWLNAVQTGSATSSSYELHHGNLGILDRQAGLRAMSVGAALVRQSFWLFGWTASFAFLPFARPRKAAATFWGLVAAAYAYRWIVPKTVVASTGPIYVFEIVPLLALASADGAVRAADLLGRLGTNRPREWIASSVLAASLVAVAAFVPVHLKPLVAGARLRDRVFVALEERGADRALVFANRLVAPEWGATWAYHPPNPSPDLADAVIFARFAQGTEGLRAAHAFWRKHFPDRRAFVQVDTADRWIFEELTPAAPPSALGARASD